MKQTLKESPKVLGLDVSTKTIGWALFDIQTQQLCVGIYIIFIKNDSKQIKTKS
jgi:RNase H-fold protein (predicted Holliday junction resolvase)